MTIPKKIWQTHRYESRDSLPMYMQGPSLSWSIENSEFTYEYVPNSFFENFILENFDKEWLVIFKLADSQITKSDIWRLLCLYKNGGIYADIDTVCIKPIDSFINMNADFVIESYRIDDIKNIDNNTDFCNYKNSVIDDKNTLREVCNSVFATKPGGFFISLLLEKIKENCLRKIKDGNTSIHYGLTGPQAISEIYMGNKSFMKYVDFFEANEIIELHGSVAWNDFRKGEKSFTFSDLDSNYKDLSLDTKNEIKFLSKSGHGGFVYKR